MDVSKERSYKKNISMQLNKQQKKLKKRKKKYFCAHLQRVAKEKFVLMWFQVDVLTNREQFDFILFWVFILYETVKLSRGIGAKTPLEVWLLYGSNLNRVIYYWHILSYFKAFWNA